MNYMTLFYHFIFESRRNTIEFTFVLLLLWLLWTFHWFAAKYIILNRYLLFCLIDIILFIDIIVRFIIWINKDANL